MVEKATASAGCWDVLVVMGSTAEKVAEFIVLSAEPVCCVMLLEAYPSLDPAMVPFKSVVEIDARPVADVAAQRRADCASVGVMPVRCHPVRHNQLSAERKNLWAALMSRVALSIVSMRFPS